MNISFNTEVCITVYYSSLITDWLLYREDSLTVGISSNVGTIVNESQASSVIRRVLKSHS
jgi:hypothetical protein